MRKALTALAAALLASCASQQKTTPSSATATAAQPDEDATTVVDPSTLNGEQVRLLQRALVDRGFTIDISGAFDPPTRAALAQFQRARGLPGTGNLNGPTMDALDLDPRDLRPPSGTAASEARQAAPTGTGSGSADTADTAEGSGPRPPWGTGRRAPDTTTPETDPGSPAGPGTGIPGTDPDVAAPTGR